MSNSKNIVVPSGKEYPSQEFVDNFLNALEATPTCTDLEKLKDKGIEAAKAYIAEKQEEAEKKIKAYFADTLDSIKARMDALKPLITPPTSLDSALTYCKNMAEYFAKPYNQMAEMVTFYGTFSAAAFEILADKAYDIGCLTEIPTIDATIPKGE